MYGLRLNYRYRPRFEAWSAPEARSFLCWRISIGWRTLHRCAIRRHPELQDAERVAAGAKWQESGLVFRTPIGTPMEPANGNKIFGPAGGHSLRGAGRMTLVQAGVNLARQRGP
jgi:hypothetical protein